MIKSVFVAFAVVCLVVVAGCSGGGPFTGLVDENGNKIGEVGAGDPVTLQLAGLTANEQYRILVSDPAGNPLNPDGGFIATADEQGVVPPSTIIQDLSETGAGRRNVRAWSDPRFQSGTVPTGDYQIVVQDMDENQVQELAFTVRDNARLFCSDSAGTGLASFRPVDPVYATVQEGGGAIADGTYPCYVVSDLNAVLQNGDTLAGTAVNLTVAGGQGTVALGLGSSFGYGGFDVVCDLNDDGKFTKGTDLISRPRRFHACFSVQDANAGGIVGQVCADKNGNYRDIFDPNATDSSIRDVWAWITPRYRSLVSHAIGVRKYVVEHQPAWSQDDPLTDVTGASAEAFDVDAVQGFCTNEAPWLIWPRQRLVAGCYDCIIDVNANGVYDVGTDFVDNIDSLGDPLTCGMRVADSACGDFITVTSHSNGQSVDTTAVTLEGTFEAAPTSAKVTVTSGTQANTVNVGVTGTTFSAVLPLFHGENILTISAVKADGVACAETFKLTSTASTSSEELFRAQLTWDGDTDMDLHLVQPGGAYYNPSVGTGSTAGDCYYGNCKVGLAGTETNTIDWGDAGDTDDPKLDVDCIACGNGIENIWMNEMPADGAYKVYVDAYSGTETAVNVAIFIRGTQVSTVACGGMVAYDDAVDSCFVGTISWSGGSSGNGTFTASGTKAGDF